jgi:hypothetical protein
MDRQQSNTHVGNDGTSTSSTQPEAQLGTTSKITMQISSSLKRPAAAPLIAAKRPKLEAEDAISLSGSQIHTYVVVVSKRLIEHATDRLVVFVDGSKQSKHVKKEPVVISMGGYEDTDEYRNKIRRIQHEAETRRKRTANATAIIEEALHMADAVDNTVVAPIAPRKYGLDLRTKNEPDSAVGVEATPTAESSTPTPTSTTPMIEMPILQRNQNVALVGITDEEHRFKVDVAV